MINYFILCFYNKFKWRRINYINFVMYFYIKIEIGEKIRITYKIII